MPSAWQHVVARHCPSALLQIGAPSYLILIAAATDLPRSFVSNVIGKLFEIPVATDQMDMVV
jgi:hypothetical protein